MSAKAQESSPATECFCIQAGDNVATLLADTDAGVEVRVLGESSLKVLCAAEPIGIGHKIALEPMHEGQRVVKYGFPIGEATRAIAQGEWVHLHNCRSLYDARSSALDLASGSRTETRYA